MRFEQFLIGILMFGLFAFVGFALFSSSIVKYNIPDANETKFAGVHDQVKAVYDEQDEMENKIRGDGVTEDATEDSMLRGGYKAISGLWGSARIMGNITNTIISEANVADDENTQVMSQIGATLMIILGILLIASLTYLVFRFMPR